MCEHKHLRCTNCELFCVDCGAKIERPAEAKPEAVKEEKPRRKGAKAK